MKVLAISYAKQVLRTGSREQMRMLEYTQGIESFVLVVFTRKSDNLPTFFQEGNLTVYGTDARTSLGIVFATLRISLRQHFANKKNWVVSSQDVFVSGLLAYLVSVLKGVHLHIQVHEDLEPLFTHARGFKGAFMKVWASHLLKRAQKIRVVSQRIQDQLIVAGIAKRKIDVLPVFSSLGSFLKVGAERIYGLDENIIFLYVGRFESVKNISLLLNAFKVAHDTNQHLKLRLVGSGSKEVLLKEQIATLQLNEAVEVTPWVDDVAGEMKRADVFVFTSKQEGYALVLVEAMAAGLPVVTTDVGCVREVMMPGIHGEVVDSEVENISKVMLSLSMDEEKRKMYGRASYESAFVFEKANHTYSSQWRDSFEIK